jgi:HEPN domain-containing protein
MKPIIIAVTLVTTLALAYSGFAQAQQADHLKQAREHVNAAVMQGEKGDTKTLVQHAETALEHVKMAQTPKPLADLEKAIKSLEAAIRQGTAGDATKATEHAKESVEYIDAATAALGG